MNKNGDRDTDFALLDLDSVTGEFKVSKIRAFTRTKFMYIQCHIKNVNTIM